MLTIFTTTKKFTGHNAIIQNNAIKSWAKLALPVEIIVFGKIEGENVQIQDIPIINITEINSFEDRIPYINDMFCKASQLAKYNYVCFLNADIILTDGFLDVIKNLIKCGKKTFLAVGQRIDFDITQELQCEKNISYELEKYKASYKIHPPYGSDIFIFPKNQYNLSNIPALLVGRPGWDLWMIFNARQRHIPLIDLSKTYLIYHQNHDYNHKIKDLQEKKKEDNHNYNFLPQQYKYIFILEFCDYNLVVDNLKRKHFNGDLTKYFFWQNYFHNHSILIRLKSKAESILYKVFKPKFS
jgi:hypothetical protein